MIAESNARLLPPRGATRYTSAKTAWIRKGRASIQITIQGVGVGVLPIWIPYDFLHRSGDCNWNYVLSVCAGVVDGQGRLQHASSGSPIDMQTVPTVGQYVYTLTSMPIHGVMRITLG